MAVLWQNSVVVFFCQLIYKFFNGGPLWLRNRPQWHVYIAELGPSSNDKTEKKLDIKAS
jgi:hypothetical protein